MTASAYAGKVACFGEAMVELMLGHEDTSAAALGFAGDSLNTAIYLKRLLGQGASVSFVTKFGRDSLSQRAVDFIQSETVSTDQIAYSEDRSIGLYAIETDDAGERTFSYWRSQSAARTLFDTENKADFSQLAQFNVLCFSAISLAILPHAIRLALLEELSRLREHNNVQVVFDSNFRPALWESEAIARETVAAAWRITDIALPSIDDEQALFKDESEDSLVDRLRGYGITAGALKRGEQGPRSLDSTDFNGNADIPSFESATSVVDTTAAGDSFNAGYLSAKLAGKTQSESLLAGHACSLRVIANKGAIIPKELW